MLIINIAWKVLTICLFGLLCIPLASSLEDYFISNYNELDFKYQLSNATWSESVNANGNNWAVLNDHHGAKCLSYSISTVND